MEYLREYLMVEKMAHLILRDSLMVCLKVKLKVDSRANETLRGSLMEYLTDCLTAEMMVLQIWKDFLRVCLMEMKRAG